MPKRRKLDELIDQKSGLLSGAEVFREKLKVYRILICESVRPIIAETEELAWGKAHRTLDALERNAKSGPPLAGVLGKVGNAEPQNVGSQRLLDIAKRGEVQDTALWFPTVTATGAPVVSNSNW